jgi:tetratricopeptide (TPR) repeat protein
MRINPKTILIGLAALGLVVLAIAGYQGWGHYRGWHHLQAARRAIERRDFRQASGHLKQCLAVWPDDPSVNLLAAQTLRRQGEVGEAIKQLQRCEQAKVKPDAVALEYDLIRFREGYTPEAVRMLADCAQRPDAPETPPVLEAVLTGWVRTIPPPNEQLKTTGPARDKMLADVQQAIELWLRLRPAPADQAQGLAWRARRHAAVGDSPEAEADLRRALELDPDCFEAQFWLAEAVSQREPMQALEWFKALHRRDPDNRDVRFGLAHGLRGMGRHEAARPLLEGLLAETPNEPAVLVELALLEFDLRRLAEAEALLRRALAAAPGSPDVHVALSRFLQAAGNTGEARHHYERFLQLERERKRQP